MDLDEVGKRRDNRIGVPYSLIKFLRLENTDSKLTTAHGGHTRFRKDSYVGGYGRNNLGESRDLQREGISQRV